MATYDKTGSHNLGYSVQPNGSFVCLTNEVELTTACAATEDIAVLDVPAGFVLCRLAIRVDTASAAAADVDFGLNGGDTDGFLDGVDTTSTGLKSATVGALLHTANGAGHFFSAADTIDALVNTNPMAAGTKFKVFAFGYMIR